MLVGKCVPPDPHKFDDTVDKMFFEQVEYVFPSSSIKGDPHPIKDISEEKFKQTIIRPIIDPISCLNLDLVDKVSGITRRIIKKFAGKHRKDGKLG